MKFCVYLNVGVDNEEEVVIDVSNSGESEVDEPKRKRPVIRRAMRNVQETEEDIDEVKVGKKTPNKYQKKKKQTLLWHVWEQETEKWLDEQESVKVDLNDLNEVVAETVDAPSDLIMPLLRYQREWLAWGLKQEESVSRGGILADEMGMGKTVQAIALVLAKRALRRELGESVGQSTSSSTGLPFVKTTLVICPVIACMQWVSEIDRFTTKGSNKILVYHGPNRAKKSLSDISEYDFVITTYSIVECEYRKNVMQPKDKKCKWCGKMFYERQLKLHLKYFCGPDAVRTLKQAKQEKKKGKHGFDEDFSDEEDEKSKASNKNKKRPRKEKKSDTAGPSESPSSSRYKPSGNSILHSVKWDRIILDEVYSIRGLLFRSLL